MTAAVCCVPVSPLRAEPSHKSEMVSQQLFGECCEVLEYRTDHWTRIRCQYDAYEGWCQESHITEIDYEQYALPEKKLTQEWMTCLEYNAQPLIIPLGSSLTGMKN